TFSVSLSRFLKLQRIPQLPTKNQRSNPMPFDKFVDFDTIWEQRSKALQKSLRIISLEELKKIGEEIFQYPDDTWRATRLRLIAERPNATYYQATTDDHVVFLYCLEEDIGLW